MLQFCGKGVCGGIALGTAHIADNGKRQVRRVGECDIKKEEERFERAKEKASHQLSKIYKKALTEVGEANAEIFSIHMMMLEDEDYNDSVRNIIRTQGVNAEYAVAVTGENFASMFACMEDAYMRARQTDVRDISERLVECMCDVSQNEAFVADNLVICAPDLTPSYTVQLDKSKISAFVTTRGSTNSHTAILARSMEIPAVIGVGDEFLANIKEGDFVIVDGNSGSVVINPDEKELFAAEQKQNREREKKELLRLLRGKENVTLDGRKINVYANIGSVENIGDVLYNDAGGIGLFRSEFLYLEGDDYPSEQQQFEVYKTVLESMSGKKVIIRTLDIGADKQAKYFAIPPEENPALGLRGIRICLTRPEVFRTQLRALLRASAFGCLSIMFPMIANKWELEKALSIYSEAKRELESDGVAYDKNIEIGIMIETPAAALISDELAPLVDFFSVGTNDLTQYTLACDRQNELAEAFCDTHHRALLSLIELSAENAHKNGAWIGICGELASDTSLTKEFIRMGIDELSVSPSNVLKVRQVVRNLDLSE